MMGVSFFFSEIIISFFSVEKASCPRKTLLPNGAYENAIFSLI